MDDERVKEIFEDNYGDVTIIEKAFETKMLK
jgi:hypothetical protein